MAPRELLEHGRINFYGIFRSICDILAHFVLYYKKDVFRVATVVAYVSLQVDFTFFVIRLDITC